MVLTVRRLVCWPQPRRYSYFGVCDQRAVFEIPKLPVALPLSTGLTIELVNVACVIADGGWVTTVLLMA